MKTTRICVLAYCLGMLFLGPLVQVQGQQKELPLEPAPVIIVVDKTAKGVEWRIGAKEITKNPLRGIAEVFEKHGGDPSYPVFVLIDDRLPINTIVEASGLAEKVGFMKSRYFQFKHGTQQVSELVFGQIYRYPGTPQSDRNPKTVSGLPSKQK